MTERKIISKLKRLKRVKPELEFVAYTKVRLLARLPERETSFGWQGLLSRYIGFLVDGTLVFPHKRLATAVAFSTLVLIAVPQALIASERSLPTEKLYSLKLARERFEEMILPEEQKDSFALWKLERRAGEVAVAAESGHTGFKAAVDSYTEEVERMEFSEEEEKEMLTFFLTTHGNRFAKLASESAETKKGALAKLSAYCKEKIASFKVLQDEVKGGQESQEGEKGNREGSKQPKLQQQEKGSNEAEKSGSVKQLEEVEEKNLLNQPELPSILQLNTPL